MNLNKQVLGKTVLATGLLIGAVAVAHAGGADGGHEFDAIWDLILGWSQGVLGRIIALGALIVGIAFGLVRQSVVAAVVGISMAIILQYGPDVIEGIVTASATDVTPAVMASIDNGMEVVQNFLK